MSDWIGIAISCLALGVSGVTAWFTFFRRGRLAMPQPTSVFLGPDGPMFDRGKNKVYLRTLLYSTAKRGHVVESLHLSLQRNETKQNFNVWVYGEKGDLKRGSGLFVPPEGVTFDHHFLLPEDGADFRFLPGAYYLSVFAKIVGQHTAFQLATIQLTVGESQAAAISEPHTGLYFDWGPDQQSYHPHVQKRLPHESDIEKALHLLARGGAG